jgi:enoyl-CoA hydratase/carnithine racemase
MLNTYDHPDAEALAASVAEVIDSMTQLISAARERDEVELIYVNDNRGDFSAGRDELVRSAMHGERPDLVEPIVPGADCTFLTKVRHSAATEAAGSTCTPTTSMSASRNSWARTTA